MSSPSHTKTPPRIVTTPSIKQSSVRAYYPVTPSSQPTPLCAVFLAQFNVHTGYELKWSKALDDVSLKGVEYKALPSGLHAVEKDVISFVQPKTPGGDELLYGVSVFRQNKDTARLDDRETVKMFSLGVLMDVSKHKTSMSWKPSSYSCGLEYIEQLSGMLASWDEEDGMGVFEKFFEDNSKAEYLFSPRTPKGSSSKKSQSQKRHHYLLKSDALLRDLGPLVFTVWKASILRKRILIFDAGSVEESCALSYCLSILSTIPHEILTLLPDETKPLHYLQPLYSLGVNDIDWLSKVPFTGFTGSSTDEILMYKKQLYDIAVVLGKNEPPKVLPSEALAPGATNIEPLKATQRDLKRSNIIVREFELQKDPSEISPSWWVDVTERITFRQMAWSGLYWWASAGEKERLEDEEDAEGLTEVADVNADDVERALYIVGYFQSITRRIFRGVMDVISNHEGGEDDIITFEFAEVNEMGLDPYSNEDLRFVVDLVKCWFGRDAKVGSSLANLCCM